MSGSCATSQGQHLAISTFRLCGSSPITSHDRFMIPSHSKPEVLCVVHAQSHPISLIRCWMNRILEHVRMVLLIELESKLSLFPYVAFWSSLSQSQNVLEGIRTRVTFLSVTLSRVQLCYTKKDNIISNSLATAQHTNRFGT